MRSKTPVRQPVIASARRQDLSELLRKWRRQPRKRSPLLFWTLLSLALMSDSSLLFLAVQALGAWGTSAPPVERLSYENRPYAVGQALYWSVVAVVCFAAAAAVRLRWPIWRRRSLLAGLAACLVCLGWSAAAFFDPVIRDNAAPFGDGSQGILWMASVVMGLALFLAVFFRDGFLALTGVLASVLGFLAANRWPLVFAEPWPSLPQGSAGDICLCVQVLMLLSAFAALALAWSTAAFTLMRILLAAPSSERLRRLAALCLWPIRLALVLLAASALLDGWRAIPRFFGSPLGVEMHAWNAQALGTLLVLPGCAALIYARWRGWLPPFRLLAAVVLGFSLLALMYHASVRWETGNLHFAYDPGFYMAGLFSLSLAAHAALRYYFGKQRILEV